MRTVAFTGGSGPLGSRVLGRLADASYVDRAVAVGGSTGGGSAEDAFGGLDVVDAPLDADLEAALRGAEVLLSLELGATPPTTAPAGDDGLAELQTVLEAAGAAGIRRVVHVSTAAVYGAWADNDIPLGEDSAVRPHPSSGWAVAHGEAERLVAGWADAHEGATTAILRPALILSGDDDPSTQALAGTRGVRATGRSRPVQVVHVDDVASAVALAVTAELAGPYNVSPEGWIDDVHAGRLAGAFRPPMPIVLARAGQRLDVKRSGGRAKPDPYLTHPWVVSSGRLHAAGWTPSLSNEEAIVVTTVPSPLAAPSPKRRQELALTAAVLVVSGGVAALVGVAVRARRLARSDG